MANSVDPDQIIANSGDPDQMRQNVASQMPHSAASDLSLHCLQRPICPNT